MTESLETWFTNWLSRYYVVTSPPTSSSSCEPLKNASHSSVQIKGAAGVKGWWGLTSSDTILYWQRLENIKTMKTYSVSAWLVVKCNLVHLLK